MKRIAIGLALALSFNANNAVAQQSYVNSPHTWVGYGRTANKTDCYAAVFNPENAGLLPSNIYWNFSNGNCYGLQMVGKPASSTVGKYIGACYCPYNLDKNGKFCGVNSAYVVRNGQAPQCFVNDMFRTKPY